MNQLSTLLPAAALGFVTGMRSMMALALVQRRISTQPAEALPSAPERILAHPVAAVLMPLAAAGELVGDKLPGVPDRTEPAPCMARLVIGGAVGALLARQSGGSWAPGAAAGMAGAVLSTFAMFHLRRALTHRAGLPDLPVALAEDLFAFALGRAGLR